MLVLLVIVVALLFVTSVLPFLYPGAVVSMFGVVLNQSLGGLLASTLGIGKGSLVAGGALTFQGVLVVYLPILVILLFVVRGR